jgi:hypothetical protein
MKPPLDREVARLIAAHIAGFARALRAVSPDA